MANNLEEITAAVQALPEIYQPIFGYELQGAAPSRKCEDRLADVKKIYDLLSAELGRPLRVLDLGCAQGYFSLYAAKWGGVVTGLDFQAANINLCLLLARENPDFKVNFIHTRIEDFLPTVKAGEYDLVLCFSVLHWCVKFSGFEKVQALLADMAQKIDTGIFEFALASENLVAGLPVNYREFLTGYPFIRALSYNERFEGTGVKRPFCFASTKHAYFENLGLLKIDGVLFSPYDTRTICYFCGDKFVKLFNITDQPQYDRCQREINFLNTFGGQKGLPKLHMNLSEQDEAGIRITIVRDMIMGKNLLEKIANGEEFDRWDIIRQALEWCVLFEEHGLYYADIYTHNFIYCDDGKIYPIDYESMHRSPVLYAWLYSAKLQFLDFMNAVIEPRAQYEVIFPRIRRTYPDIRYLVDLKKHLTPWQYEQISAMKDTEKFFARLYEILFKPRKKKFPAEKAVYTIAETEFLAVERYASFMGAKIQEQEEKLKEQQRRIEQLEKIIEGRVK